MNQEPKPQENTERLPYEAPVIIYEGELTTRAGSPPTGVGLDVDPAKLFGSVD
jgi:hypothetical protein